MKNISTISLALRICLLLLTGLLIVHPAAAQEEDGLSLRLSRDFGYSSGMGAMQGTFSMKASGPDNLVKVVFYIDDLEIGASSAAPFQLRFNTDSYSLGAHRMYAIGETKDGEQLRSNEIRAEFVSADQGFQAAGQILIPILAVIVIAMLFSLVASLTSGKKMQNLAPGTPRIYGAAGGAICPKCSRPFSRNFLSPNVVFGKLERCPFCGKWSIVRARSISELREAEVAELADAQQDQAPFVTEEEKVRKDLDQSRYQDL